jgi:hypothetical protein
MLLQLVHMQLEAFNLLVPCSHKFFKRQKTKDTILDLTFSLPILGDFH